MVQARSKLGSRAFLAYFLAKAVPDTKRSLRHPYFPSHCHFSSVRSYFSYFVFNVQPTPVPQNFFFFFISNHLQLKAAPAFVETVQPDFQLETFITLKRLSWSLSRDFDIKTRNQIEARRNETKAGIMTGTKMKRKNQRLNNYWMQAWPGGIDA